MVAFGQEATITASPKLILEFEELISEWIEKIIEKGEVGERDTMLLSRDLVASLFDSEVDT